MKSLRKTLISLSLVGAMLAASPLGTVKAAADSEGKYVSEVYVAYGKSEEEATKWLTDNGWEPVSGDLGAGKASVYDTAVSAVMGIHRTGNASDAITDMAVMNMKGAYSFDMYTEIVNEKKTEINAFLDSFTPVLEEYRANYNGEGSEAGKARADLVHDMLNSFYDGKDDDYSLNDTGKPLGDLFLTETKHEYGDEKYDALSEEDKLKYGDLQQIILESTPQAVLIIEQTLALAADTGEESWLDRLMMMKDGELAEVLDWIPEGTTDSAAMNLLSEKYEDSAVALYDQMSDVSNEVRWYEEFVSGNGLTKVEGESDEAFAARADEFLNVLKETDETSYDRYFNDMSLNAQLKITEYSGDWGETLYDFFMADDIDSDIYMNEFLCFAAALSDGQRAGMEFIPLTSLLKLGSNEEEAVSQALPNLSEFKKDNEAISIYSGMKRAIFRDGVALTSEALAERNKDRNPYENLYDFNDLTNICTYGVFAAGLVTFSVGLGVLVKAKLIDATNAMDDYLYLTEEIGKYDIIDTNFHGKITGYSSSETGAQVDFEAYNRMKERLKNNEYSQKLRTTKIGGTIMVIGGVIMLAAATYKGYQFLSEYYHHDFTKIPLMIVDEADIVTYRTDSEGNQILDENGKPVRDINFDQFAYYDAVRCNRQIIGISSDAQSGVESYAEWGCGNVADLNCDYGKEWLALYTNKSSAKGNPILADSLTVQYGSNALPEDCTKSLHAFRNTYAFNVANDTYSFNDKKNGIYLFWNEDPEAFGTTASAAGSVFGTGLAALFGVGGLGLGILGTMLVMMPRRKKEEV